MAKILPLLIILLCAFPVSAQTKADLNTLKKQISALEAELKTLEKNKAGTVAEISAIRAKISAERQAAALLEGQMSENNKQIKKLQQEEAAIAREHARLETEARKGMLFLIENSGGLAAKSVLAGADSGQLAAVAELTGELAHNLDKQIQAYIDAGQQLAAVRQDIDDENRLLAEAKAEHDEIAASYGVSEEDLERRLLLVKQDEAAQKEYLSMLLEEQKGLENALSTAAKKAPPPQVTGKGVFAGLKGTLPYPVRGVIVDKFGKKVIEEVGVEIQNKGVKISPSPYGKGNVTSVAKGTVVYVDHVPGLQNVIIIQHDEEYYSVYGNLDEFYVLSTYSVNEGDSLGRIYVDLKGNSSYLYFEIRRREQALDPAQWLKKLS